MTRSAASQHVTGDMFQSGLDQSRLLVHVRHGLFHAEQIHHPAVHQLPEKADEPGPVPRPFQLDSHGVVVEMVG